MPLNVGPLLVCTSIELWASQRNQHQTQIALKNKPSPCQFKASPGSQLTILAVPAPNMARRRSRASRSWGEVRFATRRAAPLIMEQAKSPNCRNHTGALPGPLVTSCHLPGNPYAANLPGPQGLPLRERHPSRLSGTGFASDPKKCNHLQRNP